MKRILESLVLCCCFGAALNSCSNIDCPLDNVVMMQCNLYSAETEQALTLTAATLNITAAGTDSILLNQATGIKSFLLPLKESGVADTLLLNFSNSEGLEATDTLFVRHTPQPHFESLDCPASVFHTISEVSATTHPLADFPLTIDSVKLVRSTVNYDDIENIRIFLRSTSGN